VECLLELRRRAVFELKLDAIPRAKSSSPKEAAEDRLERGGSWGGSWGDASPNRALLCCGGSSGVVVSLFLNQKDDLRDMGFGDEWTVLGLLGLSLLVSFPFGFCSDEDREKKDRGPSDKPLDRLRELSGACS
jgi:hypothetical protein